MKPLPRDHVSNDMFGAGEIGEIEVAERKVEESKLLLLGLKRNNKETQEMWAPLLLASLACEEMAVKMCNFFNFTLFPSLVVVRPTIINRSFSN